MPKLDSRKKEGNQHVRRLCWHSERSFGSAGRNADRDTVDYSLAGSETLQAFGILAALGTIAFSLGDTVLPEVQATCKVLDPQDTHPFFLACYHLKSNFLTSKLVLCRLGMMEIAVRKAHKPNLNKVRSAQQAISPSISSTSCMTAEMAHNKISSTGLEVAVAAEKRRLTSWQVDLTRLLEMACS